MSKANEKQVAGSHYKDMCARNASDSDPRNFLSYDPESGAFTWRVRLSSRVGPGDVAGWYDKEGYKCITVRGRKYKAHRLAWLFIHGSFPPAGAFIDHVNNVPDDNRACNLRIASPAQSALNRKAQKNNASGCKGVFLSKGYWVSAVKCGDTRVIKYFKNKDDALAHRQSTARKLHGDFYNG